MVVWQGLDFLGPFPDLALKDIMGFGLGLFCTHVGQTRMTPQRPGQQGTWPQDGSTAAA